ncbi:hypothetical protein VOLCADRAFT_108272 [Volvox carteri f. nagariensis]|uniref:Uncharacterized protein n=1 Tax=Volvox carteri f. nagariensis TaxID=3068 RepID=D8UJ79_VOLCA|nr:uncharacterized protein VOLCADRAFT_108272 [Volvox carteri f. nagariensis]EFJ40237.1 hypothetical protein VOLCADRAFT_108272 [Volvox carteri f. nagariensis]|eukprot:XP_002958717.1 hypothetical protein VOLCADRAFT_108272 [Volvox carteri f. nagariensis]
MSAGGASRLLGSSNKTIACRDSVKERLSLLLGRPKRRSLDLGSLQRLPATELVQACRQARLHIPPGSDPDPHLLALALHEWLNAPEADTARRGSAASGWERPASLHQSNWLRQAGFGANANAAGGSISGVAPVAAIQPEVDDEAAEAALHMEAERQADALFDEELRRRLQQAAAAAAGTRPGTASIATGGGGNQGELRPSLQRQLPVPPAPPRQSAAELQQQEPFQQQTTASQSLPPQQQQQLVGERSVDRHESASMLTTDLLAAVAAGSGSSAASSASGLLSSRMVGGKPDDGSLYDSPPSMGPPRPSEVVAAVRRSLSRAGYQAGDKDPTTLRSLLLLSRGELMRLVEAFHGGRLLDTTGQSREQLATRLLDMMAMTMRANTDSRAGSSSSTASRSGSSTPGAAAGVTGIQLNPQAAQAAGEAEKPGRGGGRGEMGNWSGMAAGSDRRRAVTWLRQDVRVMEDGRGGEEEEVWDDDRAALGDPRRRQVLAAARRRQQLMVAAARPEEIATWLVKARAQDVVVISDSDSDGEAGSGTTGSEIGFGVGSGSRVSYTVLATALSQRHAYACAEAVRFQVRERLEEMMLAGSYSSESPDSRSGSMHGGSTDKAALEQSFLRGGAPSVSGFNGADWLSLEAGRVQVHVLTPQARRYYRLEELLAGPGYGDISRSNRSNSRLRDPTTRLSGLGEPRGLDGPAARPGLHDRDPPVPSERGMQSSGEASSPSPPLPVRPRMRLFGPDAAGADGGPLLDTLETARVETVDGPLTSSHAGNA